MNGNTRGEIVDEASSWLVGGGIVTMALFPLALPGLVLAAVAVIPVVAVALVATLLAGAVIAPVLLVRALTRKMAGLRLHVRRAGPVGRPGASRERLEELVALRADEESVPVGAVGAGHPGRPAHADEAARL
jgi:hypothetical protein